MEGIKRLLLWKLLKGGGGTPTTITGNLPLILQNAKAKAISLLKRFGLCVQDGTPTPSSPVDIVCNNGRVVAGNCISSIPDGQGTFITPSELTTNRVYKAFPTDLVVGRSYTVTVTTGTGTNWLIIVQQKKPDGTSSANVSGWVTTYDFTPEEGYIYGVAMRRSQDNITPADFNGTLTLDTTDSKPWTVGTPEVLTTSGKNLFDTSLFDTESFSIKYTTFSIPNGKYTMSSPDFPVGTGSASNVFIMAGEATSGASSSTNGVTSLSSRTITVTDGKYTIAYRSASSNNTNNPKDFKWQLEYGEAATDYEPYVTPQTASVPMLLSVGGYKDEAELISGLLTHKVGIKVLDGTETWTASSSYPGSCYTAALGASPVGVVMCSHFAAVDAISSYSRGCVFKEQYSLNLWFGDTRATAVADLTAFLTAQYANGTPVIVLYALATETTEHITPQHLHTTAGTNIVDSTSNVSPVEAEVKYTV